MRRPRISHHAVVRWCERVKPAYDPRSRDDREKARYEIETCIARCGRTVDEPAHFTTRPDDARENGPAERIDHWIELEGLGIFFPVRDNVVLSTLTARAVSETTRRARNAAKARERQKRQRMRAAERFAPRTIWR